MDTIKRNRVTRVVIAIVGTILLCPILVHFGHKFGPALWGNLHVVNFIVAWIPAVLSILVAFVPDKELAVGMRVLWRISVIVCGLLYSATLWHQQTLADAQSSQQIQDAVNQAVSKANEHSDDQFKAANQHADAKFGDVEGDVKDVSNQNVALSQALAKATGDINTNLGKVGKPDPPVPARIEFSLWDDAYRTGKPILGENGTPDAEGNYPVSFTFVNASESTAESLDVWIEVCKKCSFVKEPTGYEKPAGIDDRVRHRNIGSLNPQVSFEKQAILVKSEATDGYFQVGFHYSCKTCGGKMVPNQVVTVLMATTPAKSGPLSMPPTP